MFNCSGEPVEEPSDHVPEDDDIPLLGGTLRHSAEAANKDIYKRKAAQEELRVDLLGAVVRIARRYSSACNVT